MIKLNGTKNAEDAIRQAGMLWEVQSTPVIGCNGLNAEGYKLLYRSDNNKALSICKDSYTPISNSNAFAFFDTICEKYGARYEYAQEIRGGRKIVLQAKLGRAFEVRPGDVIEQYATLVTSHDSSSSFLCWFTPIRCFCLNQLRVAMANAHDMVSIRHTSNAADKMNAAIQFMTRSTHYFRLFKDKAAYLAQKMMDRYMVEKFLEEVLGKPESARAQSSHDAVLNLIENGKGQRGFETTAWSAWNGLTEWIDHERGRDISRFESSLTGEGSRLREHGFEVLLHL